MKKEKVTGTRPINNMKSFIEGWYEAECPTAINITNAAAFVQDILRILWMLKDAGSSEIDENFSIKIFKQQ